MKKNLVFVGLCLCLTGLAQAVEVTRFEGVTFLEKPIVLTPADSGRVFEGGEGAVISGGIKLGPWQDAEDGVWVAPAPRTAEGNVMYVDQLWVDGERAPNSRVPEVGYLRLTNTVNQAVTNTDSSVRWCESIRLLGDDVPRLDALQPVDIPAMSVGVITKWSFARRQVTDYHAASNTLVTFCSAPWFDWKPWSAKESLVELFNVRTAFDKPGEWFFDQTKGLIAYRPRATETKESLQAFVPRHGLSSLVIIEGQPQNGKFVENVTFRNLSFENTSFTVKTKGEKGLQEIIQMQAAVDSDGVIQARGARNCRFENCRVAHTGNYAMRFSDGCVSNSIVNCVLEDLGAGGIWMGANRLPPRKRQLIYATNSVYSVAFNLISNCTIRAAGKYNPEGTGVALTHCSDTRLVHCEITNILYTGVSVGWTWGFAGSVAQRNEIAYNHISNLGQGIMSDMGGVYTLGTSYGTRVHDNVIHDVKSFSYGGWALYCDEGSEDVEMTRNLCWNTTDGGFHQHYGTGCRIHNNIFLWNEKLGAVRTIRDVVDNVPCTLHFYNNIVVVREGPLVGKGVRRVKGVWANNVWWDVRGESAALFDTVSWSAWQASGHEVNGIFADPLFVDLAGGDYRLRPESPAIAHGFVPFDMSAAGAKTAK